MSIECNEFQSAALVGNNFNFFAFLQLVLCQLFHRLLFVEGEDHALDVKPHFVNFG